MRFRFGRKPKEAAPARQPSRQIWDHDPTAAGLDMVTGMPTDLLTPGGMPDCLVPKLDPDKTRVFDDELDAS